MIGQRDELGWVLAGLGAAALGLGDLPTARQCFCEALQIAIAVRSFMTLMVLIPTLVLLQLLQGELEQAVELYALCLRYPAVANSQISEEWVGQYAVGVMEALPPEVVAAAQERGRARDLWDTAAELLDELENMTP
jgi:hypothetical protein